VVAGLDRPGTFYAVQTLRQLLRPVPSPAGHQSGPVAAVRVVTIRDKPDHAVRAVDVLLDASSGEFHSQLIDRILAPYKFNTLIVEAEDVQWERGRALLSPDASGARKAQVTCDRARGVYPAVYDPERTITVNGTATTLNEALIFPILKEAIDLFRPAYLHLGHDEVRGPSGLRYDMELYLRDIVTLSRFLR